MWEIKKFKKIERMRAWLKAREGQDPVHGAVSLITATASSGAGCGKFIPKIQYDENTLQKV
jgi:hypothetical protein